MKKIVVGLFLSLAALISFVSCASMPFGGTKLTSKPYLLPAGTDGSIGPEGTYVLFGDWPQTVKDNDVSVDVSKSVMINGWTCYEGTDGCFYVKAAVSLLGDSDFYNDGEVFEFSNGDAVKEGEIRYFKMEPIKWRVVTEDYNGKKLLVAENALTNIPFSTYGYDEFRSVGRKNVYANDYKYSNIRAYLNGLDGSKYFVKNFEKAGFINMAFIPSSVSKIKKVPGLKDRIFLLDLNEVTTEDWGFGESADKDFSRSRPLTDYAKALGVGLKSDNCYYWWLRDSDGNVQGAVNNVDYRGTAGEDDAFADSDFCGVVPALLISCGYSPLADDYFGDVSAPEAAAISDLAVAEDGGDEGTGDVEAEAADSADSVESTDSADSAENAENAENAEEGAGTFADESGIEAAAYLEDDSSVDGEASVEGESAVDSESAVDEGLNAEEAAEADAGLNAEAAAEDQAVESLADDETGAELNAEESSAVAEDENAGNAGNAGQGTGADEVNAGEGTEAAAEVDAGVNTEEAAE